MKEQNKYDFTANIKYETDEEYQEQLEQLLKINTSSHVEILDELYEKTKNDQLLVKLYTLAAEKQLLETNPEMGLVLLFSYDCFYSYHQLLQYYFSTIHHNNSHTQSQTQNGEWSEENEYWKKIWNYFSPNKSV